MKILKFARKNKLLALIVITYIVLMITMPNKGIQAFKNSTYYLKEMLEIMPAVFIIIAVIETWVSKETIIKNLGDKSGVKGGILSFILGSVSAGPIYAAFPICKLLLGKGASVANIVIILSAWAVIKIPMLINEVKFLGMRFMGIRWVLTVVAIIIMGKVMKVLVKKSDMPKFKELETEEAVRIYRDYCIGCGVCCRISPEDFELNENKAKFIGGDIDEDKLIILKGIVEKCPAKAVVINKNKIKEKLDC